MKRLTNSVLALMLTAGLGLVLIPGTANAEVLANFTVDPTAYDDEAIVFEADKIIGGFGETFTATSATEFSTDAWWDASNFYTNDGLTEIDNDITGLGGDYDLYAVFEAEGTYEPNALGGFDFHPTSGALTVYLDPQDDTDLDATALPADAGTGSVNPGDDGDDIIIATANLFSGFGQTQTATEPDSGSFEIIFSPFLLTLAGTNYFILPEDFYTIMHVAGQFNFFEPVGSQQLNGSADVWFVPEPASMLLLGMGLLGSGYVARRRRKA